MLGLGSLRTMRPAGGVLCGYLCFCSFTEGDSWERAPIATVDRMGQVA